MTAHVLLPYGFCIGLGFKNFGEAALIRDLNVDDHELKPGPRTWDGAYTCLSFRAGNTEITVESTARDGEQYILITPAGRSVRPPALVIEASLLWGKSGAVLKRGENVGASFSDGKTVTVYTTGQNSGFVLQGVLKSFDAFAAMGGKNE